MCQKSGFWWRRSCSLSAGSVCRSISIYVWNFILLCTYLTLQLKGMQTIKMTALLSIRDTYVVTTNTPKPWLKYDSQRYSRCLCHHAMKSQRIIGISLLLKQRLAKSRGADCTVTGANRPHARPKFGWEDMVWKYRGSGENLSGPSSITRNFLPDWAIISFWTSTWHLFNTPSTTFLFLKSAVTHSTGRLVTGRTSGTRFSAGIIFFLFASIRLPPRYSWGLLSPGMLRGIEW